MSQIVTHDRRLFKQNDGLLTPRTFLHQALSVNYPVLKDGASKAKA